MRMHHRSARGSAFGIAGAGAAFLSLLLGFLDITSSTQMIGLAAAATSIPFVNPPPKNNGEKRISVTPVPLFVRIKWGDGLPHDIDLWIRCYNLMDGRKENPITIGFANVSQGWMDVLRDDLGAPSFLNEEQAQSNSEAPKIPDNAVCWFNLHLYNSHDGPLPVDVQVVIIQNKDSDAEKLLGDVKVHLDFPGQEVTALRAAWDEHRNPIMDSIERFPTRTELIATAH